jgi:hypothetical protein
MTLQSFEDHDLLTVSDALDIAEDATGNFYKFSMRQWKRHHYDIKTLFSLKGDEVSKTAFAVLNKGSRIINGFEPKTKGRDFYFICLQDHRILDALRRDKELGLLPLLVYVFTHELVHIVRFCNFFQRFDVSGKEKDKEETVVHAKTYEILGGISLSKMDYVLDAYKDHRVCDMVAS